MFLRKLFLTSYSVNIARRYAVNSVKSRRHISTSNLVRNAAAIAPAGGDVNFADAKFQKYLESLRQEFYALRVNAGGDESAYARMKKLDGVVQLLEQYRTIQGNMASKEDMANEKDEDMRQLIEEENEVYADLLCKTQQQLMTQMLTLADNEHYPSLIFEVNAGAGGQEAMLFATELLEMYTNFFQRNGWDYETIDHDTTDIGGLRHANLIVHDADAYNTLRYEAGVHRVQRVPTTEKSGRMHTSTVSVAVIPRPVHINVSISEKDLKIETKRASGAGGQHVNTTDSAVRVVHLPTGIAIESQSERSQIKNREIAIKRLQAKLELQLLQRAAASTQATRKAQQGNLDRNEKIRTYNFVQDRVTDHRLQGGTLHNLLVFLEGGAELGSLMTQLAQEHRRKRLAEMIASWREDDGSDPSEGQQMQKSVKRS